MTAPVPAASASATAATNSSNSSRTTTLGPVSPAKPRKNKPRSRSAPSPNSILDRPALVRALEDAGLYGTRVQPMHVNAFYQALHRQHYPDLDVFVQQYYQNEQDSHNNISSGSGSSASPSVASELAPLKNAVSRKKNRNKQQLPKAFLDYLVTSHERGAFVTVTSTVAQSKTSADASTTKLAVRLHDGQVVESVLMRYTKSFDDLTDAATGSRKSRTRGNGSNRASLCVSSQCGCAMGCTFCATGTMGLSGNLTTGEILEQIVHADRILAEEWKTTLVRLEQQQKQEEAEEVEEEQQRPENPSKNTEEDTRRPSSKSHRHHHRQRRRPLPKLDLVRNVVFMGMGEPLDNYKNVVGACRALIDVTRWNLAHGRVTVSTVGIVNKIRKLTHDLPQVNLALSLHAPTQDMRSKIVPTARHFPIQDLIDALDEHMMSHLMTRRRKQQERNKENGPDVEGKKKKMQYTIEERIQESSRRRAMIEYVMLEGDTSTLEAAHQLGKLLQGRQLVVNLIPYNQTDVQDKLSCPSDERLQEFRTIVSSYGAFCTIRRTMGADIDSACGQLLVVAPPSNNESGHMGASVRDIEDVVAAQPISTATSSDSGTKLVKATTWSFSGRDEPKDRDREKLNLDAWVRPLAVATTLAATCFLVTTAVFVKQRRR